MRGDFVSPAGLPNTPLKVPRPVILAQVCLVRTDRLAHSSAAACGTRKWPGAVSVSNFVFFLQPSHARLLKPSLLWWSVQTPAVTPNSGLSSALLVPPNSPSSSTRGAWRMLSSRSIWRHAAGWRPLPLSPTRSRLQLPRVLNIPPA